MMKKIITLKIKRKGNKLVLEESELQNYMEIKLKELINPATNIITALIMITLVVLLTFFKAGDIYFFALVLLPLLGRVYIGDLVSKWLRNHFRELITF
jgi:hypothetical protein